MKTSFDFQMCEATKTRTRKVGVRSGIQQLPTRIALDSLSILRRNRNCAPSEDEALQQGIGGKAIGTVQSGAGNLAGREQATDARLPMQARLFRVFRTLGYS
jgi:hypothetical protein